jgi:hypothetical protein
VKKRKEDIARQRKENAVRKKQPGDEKRKDNVLRLKRKKEKDYKEKLRRWHFAKIQITGNLLCK